MDYGFGVPTRGPLASPDTLVELAQSGEALGFGIINVSDHIVIPRDIASIYPYNVSGEFAGDPSGECLEQLTTLTYIAANTTTARLLTSVMVLPHRPPVLTAKILATIDVLSKGRLNVGCGVGWMREEFEAIGAEPFDERGAVGDEYLRVFKELWTSDDPSFDGKYRKFEDISFMPKPVQKPRPPLWIGGESPPALRRAARLGDAWYPIGSNPKFPVGNASQLSEMLTRLHGYVEREGRDPSDLDIAFSAGWYNENEEQFADDGSHRPFTGSAEQIASDINDFEELGVRHLILGFQAPTLEATLDRMNNFMDKVKPLV